MDILYRILIVVCGVVLIDCITERVGLSLYTVHIGQGRIEREGSFILLIIILQYYKIVLFI